MFGIMRFLFPIGFFAVLGVIIFTAVRGIIGWSRNNAQPRIPAEAKVAAKRADVSHHRHHTAGDHHHAHTSASTVYYITFEFLSGDRMELHVPAREYGLIAEGDGGILTSQGTRFISFERR
ncbi:MAG: DUF2500 domain-containing protein [Oscillospiraceae bacterium]|nr:DUF2500 domain-containing protein [Oscillospiraceae bacterium]